MSKDNSEAEIDGELEALLDTMFRARNFDFRDYKKASLKRRLQKRLDAHHIRSYEEYTRFLEAHPEEYDRLFDTLLINVTEFFRDPEAWGIVQREVLPVIVSKKRKGSSIRIWSAACATGEEPYTIGILLAEYLGDEICDFEIKIYATDVDDSALTEARKGWYPPEKLKMLSAERLEKYFTREDDGYRISRSIRQLVSFGRLDLTADPPLSQLDLLVCRNVLMYFNSTLQARLMHRFSFAVAPEGYLFLGKSEGITLGSRQFKTVDGKWKIYQKISDPQAADHLKKPWQAGR